MLRAVPVGEVRALLAGTPQPEPPETSPEPVEGLNWHPEYPQSDTFDGWAMLLAAHEVMGSLLTSGDPPRWWVHQIVVDGEVVGDIGFHGPPDLDERLVEIGYNVVPGRRGRGLATQACAMIIELAWRDGADRVVASTEPDNVGSQKVLLHNGFRRSADGGFSLERPR